MGGYRGRTVEFWIKVSQEYPYSEIEVDEVSEYDLNDDYDLAANERIVKVQVELPDGFCKPVFYTTKVTAPLQTPIMPSGASVPDDKHVAFPDQF
jgi:hypothetical protein